MKALHRSSLMLVIALAASAPLSAQTFVSTGFEDPITLGDLNGQDGWMVTPSEASATVQNTRVRTGLQALDIVDAASFGRAQKNISNDVVLPQLWGSMAMYVDDAWKLEIEADRFEAQARIEGDNGLGTFGIEFGFVLAPAGGYGTVPGGASAFYLEIGTESASLGTAYTVVDYSAVANAWHVYDMLYDNTTNQVSLFVDGTLQVQVGVTDDILSVSGIQLQNQRWGTSPMRNASLYFDDVSVYEAVPEPASMLALAAGIGALAMRRRRS